MTVEERVEKLEAEMVEVKKFLNELVGGDTPDPLEASHQRFAVQCAENDRRRLAGE